MRMLRPPMLVIATAIALLFVAVGCGDTEASLRINTGTGLSQQTNAAAGLQLTVSIPGRSLAYAETDRTLYSAGDSGLATFLNTGPDPLFLPGCAPFFFEQRLDGHWAFVGPPFVCVWEGLAIYVGMNETDSIEFIVPSESGLYRLRYDHSSGCEIDVPLSQANCEVDFVIYSNVFEVERELCDPSQPACRFVPGAPNILCADGVNVSGPSAECTRDPETWECGYEFLSCP
jgi:hypothetical protein